MGFLDALDGRKAIARWVAKLARKTFGDNIPVIDEAFVMTALTFRYAVFSPKGKERHIVDKYKLSEIQNIFALCHLFLEVELLSHLSPTDRVTLQMKGENIIEHTYGLADKELTRLGFGEAPAVTSVNMWGIGL